MLRLLFILLISFLLFSNLSLADTIALRTGWNMFSTILKTMTTDQIKTTCGTTNPILTYNSATGGYSQATQIVPGKGYWIKLSSDCTLDLDSTITVNDIPNLLIGWNQIGGPSTSVIFNNVKGTCAVISSPLKYNPATRGYSTSSTLDPGIGYWVKVSSDCSLGSGSTANCTSCGSWTSGTCGGSCADFQRQQIRACAPTGCTPSDGLGTSKCVDDSLCNPKCSDGTPYGSCNNSNKPKYCSSGTLIDKCSTCGCPSGQDCNTTTQTCYTPQTCSCGSWSNVGCGLGGCPSNQRQQTRICTPTGCTSSDGQGTSKCVDDTSCQASINKVYILNYLNESFYRYLGSDVFSLTWVVDSYDILGVSPPDRSAVINFFDSKQNQTDGTWFSRTSHYVPITAQILMLYNRAGVKPKYSLEPFFSRVDTWDEVKAEVQAYDSGNYWGGIWGYVQAYVVYKGQAPPWTNEFLNEVSTKFDSWAYDSHQRTHLAMNLYELNLSMPRVDEVVLATLNDQGQDGNWSWSGSKYNLRETVFNIFMLGMIRDQTTVDKSLIDSAIARGTEYVKSCYNTTVANGKTYGFFYPYFGSTSADSAATSLGTLTFFNPTSDVWTRWIMSSKITTYSFAVIGDKSLVPELNNINSMFGNLSIKYKMLLPSQVINENVFSDVDAIVSFVDNAGALANATAVNEFAKRHIVISNGYDFANYYYSSYRTYYSTVSTQTVNYTTDWGNFPANSEAEFHRADNTLGVFSSSIESNLSIIKIAKYNTNVAIFHANGLTSKSGFYVMDLKATSNETQWNGIWHIFPAVKMIKDFPTGKYSEWMANGTKWPDLNWVNNYIDTLVNANSDIASQFVVNKSLSNRDIKAIVIGKGNRYAIIDGDIHGNEKTGAFSALRIAELLLEYYRSKPTWQEKLNQYSIIIIPVLNPDGYVGNMRANNHSLVYPNGFSSLGDTMMVNGSWIYHGMATGPSGVEDQSCTLTPSDTNVVAKIMFDSSGNTLVTSTQFQANLTWKADGTAVTTPTSVSWTCKETCCNLNRQFPPGGTTTEPETWGLRNLIDDKKPAIYVNMHEGSVWYPFLLGIGSYVPASYSNITKIAIESARTEFSKLKHWGWFTEDNLKVWIGTPYRPTVGVIDGGSTSYASWKYKNTSATLIETFVWSSKWGSKNSLWGLDYYPSIILTHLKNYDNAGEILTASNGFIYNSYKDSNGIVIKLDTSDLVTPSTTYVYAKNKNKPIQVFIDDIQKLEDNGWSYTDVENKTTVTGAEKSIQIYWS